MKSCIRGVGALVGGEQYWLVPAARSSLIPLSLQNDLPHHSHEIIADLHARPSLLVTPLPNPMLHKPQHM